MRTRSIIHGSSKIALQGYGNFARDAPPPQENYCSVNCMIILVLVTIISAVSVHFTNVVSNTSELEFGKGNEIVLRTAFQSGPQD